MIELMGGTPAGFGRCELGWKDDEDMVTTRGGAVARRVGRRVDEPRVARGGVVDHLLLLKPRVMSLVVFTGAVGFALAPVPFHGLALIATLSAMAHTFCDVVDTGTVVGMIQEALVAA